MFSTLATLGPGFQVLRHLSKKSNSKSCWTFLAGALGLEPRAYGFGDDADKSASGGTTFEVNNSTIQKRIAVAIVKTDQILNILGI